MASHSLMVARNLFPNPSPRLAPSVKPATSIQSIVAGKVRRLSANTPRGCRYGSGMAIGATLGSMVQNGKLLAWARERLANALKRVDLPTLGKPTIPTFIFMVRFDVEVGDSTAARRGREDDTSSSTYGRRNVLQGMKPRQRHDDQRTMYTRHMHILLVHVRIRKDFIAAGQCSTSSAGMISAHTTRTAVA
mmetsp:Transcript_36091/g.79031  ORF Transcript_36091/g.79031 Transcript_36091/m.79031 type:complete len:191 (+) Transcript_36091:860-1432(+)